MTPDVLYLVFFLNSYGEYDFDSVWDSYDEASDYAAGEFSGEYRIKEYRLTQ